MKNLFITFLLFFSVEVYTQDIKYQVIDFDNNYPVRYCAVYEKDNKKGLYTDSIGVFKIDLFNKDGVVVFSSIGYEKLEISIEKLKKIEERVIKLKKKDIELKEVVLSSKKVKSKWKPLLKYRRPKYDEVLFEGTTIIRYVDKFDSSIVGFRVEIFAIDDSEIILRPYLCDSQKKSLLDRDYVKKVQLMKGRNLVAFNFETIITGLDSSFFIGIETIRFKDNEKYNKNVVVKCSGDDFVTSERITQLNFIQEWGEFVNFDKKLEQNIYLELNVIK